MEIPDSFPADALEGRRFRALHLKRHGWSRHDIAEALGGDTESVSRGFARARDGGPQALRAHPSPGAPPKLTAAQKRLIPEFLWHGAEAYDPGKGRSGASDTWDVIVNTRLRSYALCLP
jgi:transposase